MNQQPIAHRPSGGLHLDVANISEAADPRRPGRSRIRILRALDNPAEAGQPPELSRRVKIDLYLIKSKLHHG